MEWFASYQARVNVARFLASDAMAVRALIDY
jgi:hypothetical protein